jgi:radical SAM superfamily enzyme YgiQ (UPF0313 family)
METSTPSYYADLQFAENAKANNKPTVILRGTHVTTYPDAALNNPNVDMVLRGEYEYSALKTVVSILEGKDLTENSTATELPADVSILLRNSCISAKLRELETRSNMPVGIFENHYSEGFANDRQ